MRYIVLLLSFLILLSGCAPAPAVDETTLATTQETTMPPATEVTVPPTTAETVPETTLPRLSLTEQEQTMLLKLAMSELGDTGCTECLALVMRTVLNRVDAGGFGRSIEGVILAQDQFTPVADGSYYRAQPNEACLEALEMVISGWDESQGALYYEFCIGESWHSKNLQLLFQHCNTRFYK